MSRILTSVLKEGRGAIMMLRTGCDLADQVGSFRQEAITLPHVAMYSRGLTVKYIESCTRTTAAS